MTKPSRIFSMSAALLLSSAFAHTAQAQPAKTPPADSAARRAARDSIARLRMMNVTAKRVDVPKVPALQAQTLKVSASVTAQQAQETVNIVDPEDAVKYLPSVFLRKRNNGDTQATLGTRVWGVGSSARSLVFADGVPLTALVANNNTIGGPRWGLVSPEEIDRVDMMYGPFSAAYAGNSMGAVMEISTRLPEKLQGSITGTQAMQRFDLYGTRKSYGTTQTNAYLGNRFGKFSVSLSGNYQNSNSQPLSYVTSGTFPTGTTGGFAEKNKLDAAANVLGATGLLSTQMTNAKVKLAYDITPGVRAAYTFGFWQNDASAGVDSYINRSGLETFAGQAGFAAGYYELIQQHSAHSLSLRTDRKRDWDVEAIATLYSFDKDQQRTPSSASNTDTVFGTTGRAAVLDGTGWSTLDLKGAWHRGGSSATHTVSFGVHQDQYELSNTTFNTPEWRQGAYGTVATQGDGNTRTRAVWAQDNWKLTSALRLTAGLRYENWRAFDGYNANGNTKVNQPERTATRLSPKATLTWNSPLYWTVSASAGKAYRFATPAELYQLVSTGVTFTSPDPNLKPDNVLATELRVERKFEGGLVGVSLFQDNVRDAIISQFLPLVPNSPNLFSYLANVDRVRARGAELVFGRRDLVLDGLEFTGSVTYLDARTLALSGRASATAPAGAAVGKFLPNIPKWRGNLLSTYRPNERLAISLAGRYSDKLYTTLDNADVRTNTWQGFAPWFVADARVNFKFDRRLSTSVGVDNLLNRKYFLFHPFPQRTVVASMKLGI